MVQDSLHLRQIKETLFNERDIFEFLNEMDSHYYPSLSSRVNLVDWSRKLAEHAEVIVVADEKETGPIIGLVAFYCNDRDSLYSYIPALGVLPEHGSKGIAGSLLRECMDYVRAHSFKTLGTRTWSGNKAVALYEATGFREISRILDRPNGVETVYLEAEIGR